MNQNRKMFKSLITAAIASLVVFAAAPVSAQEVIKGEFKIKMATPSAPEDSCVMAFYKFKELVENRSKGRIAVQVFPNGQLGDQASYITQMQAGNLQIGEVNTAVLGPMVGEFAVFDLSYISKDMDHQIRVLDSGLGDKLSKELEAKIGLKVMGWMVRAPRNVYSSKGPISSVSDFQGLKIRVMQSPIMVKTMELLGAQPVAISANERYMALQSNVVQAAENSVPFIITSKDYEVTKFLSLTEHFITPNVIAMDAKYFNKLPPDMQKIVADAGKEAATFEVVEEKRQLSAAIKSLEEKGMKVNSVGDKTAFMAKVRPIYAEYEGKIGKDVIDAFSKVK